MDVSLEKRMEGVENRKKDVILVFYSASANRFCTRTPKRKEGIRK
jgi:hypothetical protein